MGDYFKGIAGLLLTLGMLSGIERFLSYFFPGLKNMGMSSSSFGFSDLLIIVLYLGISTILIGIAWIGIEEWNQVDWKEKNSIGINRKITIIIFLIDALLIYYGAGGF